MNRSIKNLAKIFHTINSLFMTIIIGIILVFSYRIFEAYQNTQDPQELVRLLVPLSLVVYLTLLSILSSRIETKLINEDNHNLIELLVLHALLYGVLTPFAMFDYYILYIMIVVNKQEMLITKRRKDDHYYFAKILLRCGIYFYIPFLLFKYVNLVIKVVSQLKNEELIGINSVIYFGILLFAFLQFRLAERDLNEKQTLYCIIRVGIFTILSNPFTFHGLAFIIAIGSILFQDHQFDQLKEEFIKLKDKMVKKYKRY
jgi:hypothetical protein